MPTRKINVISYEEQQRKYLGGIIEATLIAIQVVGKTKTPEWGRKEMEKLRAKTDNN